MTKQAKHPVKTIEKSIALIEELKDLQSAGVTELAEQLDIGPSAVHNHLNTLREHGYVIQEGERYRLGLKFLDLGGSVRKRMVLYNQGKAELNELAKETGELVNLMTEELGEGVYLHRAKGEQGLDFDTYPGARRYLHSTALGKAILAHLPRDEVERIIDLHGLPKLTENTITEPDDLFEELKLVRERGYAIDDEEHSNGLRCMAAPIHQDSTTVLGSVSITAPTSRLKGQKFEELYPDMIQRTANVIELNIKYN